MCALMTSCGYHVGGQADAGPKVGPDNLYTAF